MLGMEHFLIPLRPMNTEAYFQPSVAQVNGAAGTLGVPQRAETSLRQSGFGLSPADTLSPTSNYSADHPKVQIFHPSQAPSGQITENILMARALMSPAFAHSGAASKMARLSNMFQDLPRFGSAVNLVS